VSSRPRAGQLPRGWSSAAVPSKVLVCTVSSGMIVICRRRCTLKAHSAWTILCCLGGCFLGIFGEIFGQSLDFCHLFEA